MKAQSVLLLGYLAAMSTEMPAASGNAAPTRYLYAVVQSSAGRGSISVYDIGDDHRLVRRIETVPGVGDVKGVAASAATGRLYVSYRTTTKSGKIYCVDLVDNKVLWDQSVTPDVDRLAINPSGQLLYVPTWEGNRFGYINVIEASTGHIVKQLHFSNASHDTLYPLSGPIFQETKAVDGSGRYLYMINPTTYEVASVGPYSGVLGPYAVNGRSTYVVNNVTGVWGMEVADIGSGRVVTAQFPDHPEGSPGLLHGIAWTPDEKEVWEASAWNDPHVYIWDMSKPMAPTVKERLDLHAAQGSHWITFDIDGDYAYVSPNKNSEERTEVFDAHQHRFIQMIESSEDMLEIDFIKGKVVRVGDQYGIGRVQR